ncbi:hypothetical protein LCGC14_2405630, partial [marine sediment metagenome]
DKQLDKLLGRSSRQELVEFLQDPECDLDSAILCYRKTNGDYGYQKLEGSAITSIVGMLRIIGKYFERIEVDGIAEMDEDED